ncbi:Protein-serine/threonine phosphatase [Psidium guajava]|nr:Protein-serine/threonine phosphatase [Psidium guajava]
MASDAKLVSANPLQIWSRLSPMNILPYFRSFKEVHAISSGNPIQNSKKMFDVYGLLVVYLRLFTFFPYLNEYQFLFLLNFCQCKVCKRHNTKIWVNRVGRKLHDASRIFKERK